MFLLSLSTTDHPPTLYFCEFDLRFHIEMRSYGICLFVSGNIGIQKGPEKQYTAKLTKGAYVCIPHSIKTDNKGENCYKVL